MAEKDEYGAETTIPEAAPVGAVSDAPVFRAIEEYAASLKVSAPVFAAVKQARGWAEGKKVGKAEFEKAVQAFLNAPAGGIKR
jgi:hypothetical protein